ncbi:hypothetical protein ACTI_49960 [Actinoplanes sp. OR16]|nr:hypothetical protein ACTI_49960 [Actinoplanes sp. OR16]
MYRFGIQNYDPQWLNGRDSINGVHGERLARLAGRNLRHVWAVWDVRSDEWFSDAPVLLDFGDQLVSIDHQKFDDVCITWNILDPARAIEDDSEDSLFDLVWRPDATPQLAELAGRTLERVVLLEWAGGADDMANGSIAIGLDLAPSWLTIYNALDENGFAYGDPDDCYRQHPLAV